MTTVILKLAGVTRGEMCWSLEQGAGLLSSASRSIRTDQIANSKRDSYPEELERAALILETLREAIEEGPTV